MAVFKCKMCGGTLEVNPGESVAVCDSCGSKQTIPNLSDDRRANLYDRANHFRRANDFDKAMALYEQILNDDNSDAEAHWSIVLCRYGIEYVEDPSTQKRVPTVNRAQFTSVFSDEDYKAAIEHADGYQRDIYESEAKAIDEIQKGILAISQKEEPFDVFISFKETDENGQRTPDAVLANDLYHQLTQEGFKVFFAPITLEDKLGTEYEPYIFAALNSAKVMIALGTKPEYFNAVWVKNEWSRFLTLIKNGAKKTLIPAYKDMDPYDLPEEFSHLMAQDMSKLGFMQDIIRGIKKICATEQKKETVKETVTASSSPANIAPLLKRAFMFLEDRDWSNANEYCEKVLDQDPENAQAYLGKLLAETRCSANSELKDCDNSFENSNNYKKAVRFGGEELKNELDGYIRQILDRNEEARLNGLYNKALSLLNSASSESDFSNAAECFKEIKDYRDSEVKISECLEKAENARKNAIYSDATGKMSENTVDGLNSAITVFKTIQGWRDSDAKVLECEHRIQEIRAEEEADRLEAERIAEEKRIAAEKAMAKKKKIIKIVSPIAVALIAFLIVLTKVIIPNGNYNKAVKLYNAGQYEEAIAGFEALNGYKDSEEQVKCCNTAITEEQYNYAVELYNSGKYKDAMIAFEALDGYKDSAEKISAIKHSNEYFGFAEVGDTFFFGNYGSEEIEWRVLDKQDDKVLVISEYGLDAKPYNEAWDETTWEKCTLRKWLNNEFLNSAFSAGEQAMIQTTKVTADRNPSYDTDPGNDTEDKVFLLSIDEAKMFFASKDDRICYPTDYAVSNGCWTSTSSGSCWWWLRSPGHYSSLAAYVGFGGVVNDIGISVRHSNYAVRPALWINLES